MVYENMHIKTTRDQLWLISVQKQKFKLIAKILYPNDIYLDKTPKERMPQSVIVTGSINKPKKVEVLHFKQINE